MAWTTNTYVTYKTDSDVVFDELPNRGSRDEVVIASGSGVVLVGTVLGQVQSGEFIPFNRTSSDAAGGVAMGICLSQVDATSTSQRAVMLARDAQIVQQTLVWPTSTTSLEIAAALLELERIPHIKVRVGV